MNQQQREILQRTGRVVIASRPGFMASVVRNNRGKSQVADDVDDKVDPDDHVEQPGVRSRTESDAEREARLAEGRKVAAQIQAKADKREAARIGEIDQLLLRVDSVEGRKILLFARENGFELDLVLDEVLEIEREWRRLLNGVRECGMRVLGIPVESRADRFLNDSDPDVKLFSRLISNREPLPGEKADNEEEAESAGTKKKKKPGDHSGQEKEFEEAEKGKIDDPGRTDGDEADLEDFRKIGKKLSGLK